MFIYAYCTCKCVWCLCVCVSGCIGVCVCLPVWTESASTRQLKQTPQHFSWAWNLSPSRKSLSLVPVHPIRLPVSAIFQLVSSVRLLIFGSFEAEKRENTSVSVLTSLARSERSFRWTLRCVMLLVVSRVCTHGDCKWAEISHCKRWSGCVDKDTQINTQMQREQFKSTQVNSN